MAVPQTNADMKSVSGLSGFIRDTKTEMKKVTWPTRQELTVYTIVVIVATFLASGAIWIIDGVFAQVFRLLMGVH